MKIVINGCYGGFGVSPIGMQRFAELKGWQYKEYTDVKSWGTDTYHIIFQVADPADVPEELDTCNKDRVAIWEHDMTDYRDDPIFVQVVEELGTQAVSNRFASLHVVEIPDDVEWEIDEYDGIESVEEVHRSWS